MSEQSEVNNPFFDLKNIFLLSLSGKTVIITGATSGLGKEAAMNLSLRGARVILVCR